MTWKRPRFAGASTFVGLASRAGEQTRRLDGWTASRHRSSGHLVRRGRDGLAMGRAPRARASIANKRTSGRKVHVNTIYSKVWNKSLGILVVASELARANGKGGASRRLRAAMAALPLAAGVMLALGSAPAQAGNVCGGYLLGIQGKAPIANGDDAFACGTSSKAAGDYSTAVGTAANSSGMYSVALGQSAQSSGAWSTALGQNARASGTDSVAVGESSQASGSASSAFGTDASATAKNSVALGDGSVANRANTVSIGKVNEERQLVNVADGTQSTDAVNKRQLDKVSTSVTTVSGRVDALGKTVTGVSDRVDALSDSVGDAAHYYKATGNGDGSDDAQATGQFATASGSGAYAGADGATA